MTTQHFEYGEKEIQWLTSRDASLGAAIAEIGPINRPIIPDLFTALLHAIVGQQISTKAQATIWNRMLTQFLPITPESIAQKSVEEIQSCGLSFKKANYIKDLAETLLRGELNLTQLQNSSDADVCEQLSRLKGIGVWTAEMMMIFSMQRPDIFSWKDLAIHRGLRMLYRHRKITPQLFSKYKKRYAPYATVASFYLWAIAAGACEKLKDTTSKPITKNPKKRMK